MTRGDCTPMVGRPYGSATAAPVVGVLLRRLAWLLLPLFFLAAAGCSFRPSEPTLTPTSRRTAIPTGYHPLWPTPTYRLATRTPTPRVTATPVPTATATLTGAILLTGTATLTNTLSLTVTLPVSVTPAGFATPPIAAAPALTATLPLPAVTDTPQVAALLVSGTPFAVTAGAPEGAPLAGAGPGTGTPPAETATDTPSAGITTDTPAAETGTPLAGTATDTPLAGIDTGTPGALTIVPPTLQAAVEIDPSTGTLPVVTDAPGQTTGTPLAGTPGAPSDAAPTWQVWAVTALAGRPPTLTPTPTATPTQTPEPDPLLCLPLGEPVYGVVRWVADGDTLMVDVDGRLRMVRLLGIDAPSYRPNIEFMGAPAKAQAEALASGRVVRLDRDPLADLDEYGRLLRYVTVQGGSFLNYALLRLGLAQTLPQPPGLACESTLAMGQAAAQQEMLGLWAP